MLLVAHFQAVEPLRMPNSWRCKQGRIWKRCSFNQFDFEKYHPNLLVENGDLLFTIKKDGKVYYYKVPLEFLKCKGYSCLIDRIGLIMARGDTLHRVEKIENGNRIIVYEAPKEPSLLESIASIFKKITSVFGGKKEAVVQSNQPSKENAASKQNITQPQSTQPNRAGQPQTNNNLLLLGGLGIVAILLLSRR